MNQKEFSNIFRTLNYEKVCAYQDLQNQSLSKAELESKINYYSKIVSDYGHIKEHSISGELIDLRMTIHKLKVRSSSLEE